ncbi:helix-turn-helix domain-containing protein [Lihuaxuella thermophila]|uniref:Tetratricopeptide repeat-containing protein n=1 Tax=Lihuaxuella thermophila TaxID=1173111 RepID=A0A1H8BFH3_9BACL|nr:helix-turn-helix transcriptional regulator [Lihuaxuella thermophila]SEM81506.1 Tetratricopeptide repeat-containing protein [Lihuaxuella thermophila]
MDFERVGKLIRKVRQERGLRLDDLADDYIPRTTLSMIERGLSQNETKVRYLLRKLELNLSDLSERDKEEEKKRELDLLLLERKINTEPKKALTRLNKLPAEYNGPWLYYLKGRCHYKMNQYDPAVEWIYRALHELEKMPDLAKTNLKPVSLNLLSVIEHYRGNKEKALQHASEGLSCFDLNGERKPYYISLVQNKSIYLWRLDRTEKALENLENIKNINTLELNIDSVIGLFDMRARLKSEIRLYEEAIKCAKKGLYLAIVNHNYERQLELLKTMGKIYKESGQLEHALKCLE